MYQDLGMPHATLVAGFGYLDGWVLLGLALERLFHSVLEPHASPGERPSVSAETLNQAFNSVHARKAYGSREAAREKP